MNSPRGHWTTPPLGTLVRAIVPGRAKPEELSGPIPWLRIEDFEGKKYIATSRSGQGVSPEQLIGSGLKVFPKGTVVCTCSCDMGTTAIVQEPLITNQTFIGLYPRDERLRPEFLYYSLQAHRPYLNATATGAIQTYLAREDFTSLRLPIPPRSDQDAIVDFLDRETARIDSLIERKRRMIEVLREGIVVEVEERLRESSTSAIPFRRLLVEPPQYGAGESGELGEETWPRYIRITDLTADGTLRDDDVRRLPPDIARPYLLTEGDLLFARSGATVGKAFIYREWMGPSCFAGYLIRFRVDRARIAPDLVEAWTRTGHYWGQIRASSLQATIENVSAERYKDLLIPVPSKKDQYAILNSLDLRRERARRLEQSLHGQLALLQERRQALITAAVTGQLDISVAA